MKDWPWPLDNESLARLFTLARSPKSWEPATVPTNTIVRLYELVKWGPTSNNSNPARFVFAASLQARARFIDLLDPGNRKKVEGAALLCVVGCDPKFWRHWRLLAPHKDLEALFAGDARAAQEEAYRSCLLQIGYFIMAARALGLDVLPLNGFDHAGMDASGLMPPDCRSVLVCCLGRGRIDGQRPRAARLPIEEAVFVR
jgi:3-hydroxypropanoate dehydrogenase